jgi:hypothetical protein
MQVLPAHEFAAVLQAQAPDGIDAPQIAELTTHLLTAYEALRPYRPLSVRPVHAPWGGAALAFEASWPDTHALLVAARMPPEQGSPAQLTLRRAGQLEYAVSSTLEHLPAAVALCLGRHIKRTAEPTTESETASQG